MLISYFKGALYSKEQIKPHIFSGGMVYTIQYRGGSSTGAAGAFAPAEI